MRLSLMMKRTLMTDIMRTRRIMKKYSKRIKKIGKINDKIEEGEERRRETAIFVDQTVYHVNHARSTDWCASKDHIIIRRTLSELSAK